MLDLLLTHLTPRVDVVADVPILQDADPFLETAGEDMRRRLFLTENAQGAMQCLRPEFTIPICLAHAQTPGRYAYGGTVFRQGRDGTSEFQQVGLEDLGACDAIQADIACVTDVMESLTVAGVPNARLTLGDQALFAVLVRALDLPDAVVARLERNFGDDATLSRIIDDLGSERGTKTSGPAQELAKAGDVEALTRYVEALMQEGGLSARSGRAPDAIARRMIEKQAAQAFVMDTQAAKTLRAYLALAAPLDRAADAIADFAKDHALDFGESLLAFEARNCGLQKAGLDLTDHTFRASFGRKLEYYTGLLFEAHVDGAADAIAGGGRYDRLCSLLGAAQPVPAVGFSITLDRLAGVLEVEA